MVIFITYPRLLPPLPTPPPIRITHFTHDVYDYLEVFVLVVGFIKVIAAAYLYEFLMLKNAILRVSTNVYCDSLR